MQRSDSYGTGYEFQGTASNATGPLSRLDLRWGWLTFAQLMDEGFLTKQLQRIECTHKAHRSGRSEVSETKDVVSDKSIRQRLMAAQLKASRDASEDEVKATVETIKLATTLQDARERELFNAQCVLGNLQQPELATSMATKLKEALGRWCTFPNPIYQLIALRRQLIKSMHEAVAFQHRQQRTALELNFDIVNCMETSSLSLTDGGQKTIDSPGIVRTNTAKEKVCREAGLGLQMIVCLLDGFNDSTVTTTAQKREFLATLLPMLREMGILTLCPRRSRSDNLFSNQILSCSSPASDAADVSAFTEKVQKFLLHMCPRSNSFPLTTPRLSVILKSGEWDVDDRTNVADGLVHLAAATGSVRDFLVVLKVFLGVTDFSPTTERKELRNTLSSRSLETASDPSLPTFHVEELHSSNCDDHLIKSDRSRFNSSRIGIRNPLSARETEDGALSDTSRNKLLLKGIKTSALAENLASIAPSAPHPRPLYTSRGKSLATKYARTKNELKDALGMENTNPSLDVPAMKETLARDQDFLMSTPIGTARCPKIRELNVQSVLLELNRVKPLALHQARENSQGSNPFGVNHATNLFEEDESDREVWSCGQNSYGELGHGDTTSRKSFQRIESLQQKDVIQIGAGNEHTVALTANGRVFTCGYNDNGQCGQGGTSRVSHFSKVPKLSETYVSQAHAYNGCEHTIFVTIEGRAATCGYNYRGQLGHGSTTSESVPRMIQSLANKIVRLVSCSYYHTILVCEEGGSGQQFVFTFGRNDYGQLGLNDTSDRKLPQEVEALRDEEVVSAACGQYHTMVVTTTGKAFAFGKNDYGQLGIESLEHQVFPMQVRAELEKQKCLEVRCGYYHTIILCTGAHSFAFGRNDYGQLGLGRPEASASAILQLQQQRFFQPKLIEGLEGKEIVRLSCGCYHTIAVSDNGVLYVFGRNNHGQLGTGDTIERVYPFLIDDFAGKRIAQVAAGFYHTIVLTGGKDEDKTEQDLFTNSNKDATSVETDYATILSSPTIKNWLDSTKESENYHSSSHDLKIGMKAPALEGLYNDYRDEDRRESNEDTRLHTDSGNALLVALVILAQLDRLCQPFVPKRASYPMLQHPSISVIEALTKANAVSFDASCFFDGSFEAFGIHSCSSTFESLAILLKHLSTRKVENTSKFASASEPISTSQLQVYMLSALLRILQANLSQLLRSGMAKAIVLLSTEMPLSNEPTSNIKCWANDLGRTRVAILQIRDVLFTFVDIKRRRNICHALDDSFKEGENTTRIAEEATATIMQGFEVFFPCKCLKRQFFLHVMQQTRNRDSMEFSCELHCRRDLWRIQTFPKSKKLLLEPLLKRMAEDVLIIQSLPLLSSTTISNSCRFSQPIESETFYASLMPELCEIVFERVAADFSLDFGDEAVLRATPKVSSRPICVRAFFDVLNGYQKHLSSWAASVKRWHLSDTASVQSSTCIESNVAQIIDRALRVDEDDLNQVPVPWRCYLEFTMTALHQCYEVLSQILSSESLPSPTHEYTQGFKKNGNKKVNVVEIVEHSIVGQLLPLLVVSLLHFSNNPLFAATLLPTLKMVLRSLDTFNRLDSTVELAERQFVEKMTSSFGLNSFMKKTIVMKTIQRKSDCNLRANRGSDDINDSESGMTVSDAMALPWHYRLEKEMAVLTAEMAVTLVIGNSFLAISEAKSEHDPLKSTEFVDRWMKSSLFQGGLNAKYLVQSIYKRNFSRQEQARTVQHTPFQALDAPPFSLILPPSSSNVDALPLWQLPTSRNYRETFHPESIRTFLTSFYCKNEVETQPEAFAAAMKLCAWVRDSHTKKDPSYRMLVRQSQLAINLKSPTQSVEIQVNELQIEADFFAALVHHNLCGAQAYHFALGLFHSSIETRSPPPRAFMSLWHYVAQLRRRMAAKKTELKNRLHTEFDPPERSGFDPILTFQKTTLDRCKLLLLVDTYEEQEHTNVQFAGYVAPYDPAFLVAASSTCKLSTTSVKRHLCASYTDEKLPFLIAFPLSKWKRVRMALHSLIRWKFLCQGASYLVSQEVLAFVLSNEPVSSPTAINTLLVDPCRRISCSIRGLETLSELLSLVSFDSIQTDIVFQLSQVFVFQSTTASIITRGHCVGHFYLSLQNERIADLFGQLTELMTDKAARLLESQEKKATFPIWIIIVMLSAWGIHFDKEQFEFVSDIGILQVIQELMQVFTKRYQGNTCSDTSSFVDTIMSKSEEQTQRSTSSSQTQLFRLETTLWILFRYIYVHFAVQTKALTVGPDIDVPTYPVLATVAEVLLNEAVLISNQFLDMNLIKQIETAPTVSGTIRRSFEAIPQPRRFSCQNKGAFVSYEDMVACSSSALNTVMSPMLKPNEFSVTMWLYINIIPKRRTNRCELPDSLQDRQLVFLRGAAREIALYLVLVPESREKWQFEVGILMDFNRGDKAGIYPLQHRMWERVLSKQVVASGTWNHVAIVLDATKLQLYINGLLDRQRSFTAQNTLLWAAGSIDLPIHFGRFSTAFGMTESTSSVFSAIQFLTSSLGITKDPGWNLEHTLSNNALEHNTERLRCFDGWLCHFRLHNRSLSSIHVQIVFDNKKLPSPMISEGTEHFKLMELHALLILLISSSEGIVHFTTHFSKWFKLLWETFLKSKLASIQQSSLRVLCSLLPLESPFRASKVLVQELTPLNLHSFGFYTCDDIFVQQIIRIIGFCLYKCSSCEPNSDAAVVPWTLMVAQGIHGNQFSLDAQDQVNQEVELQSDIESHYQTSKHQSSMLANELNHLLQQLFRCSNATWSQCIIRTFSNAFQHFSNSQVESNHPEKLLVQFGKHTLHITTVKCVESVGCLYFLNGGAEYLRPGLTVEMRGSRDLAHVLSLEAPSEIKPSPQVGDTLAHVQIDQSKREIAHEDWSNLTWYDKVFSSNANVCITKVNIDEFNPASMTKFRGTDPSLIYEFASRKEGSTVLNTLVDKAAEVLPDVYSTKGTVWPRDKISGRDVNSIRDGWMLLRLLAQVAGTDAGVDALLAKPSLLAFLIEVAIREDSNCKHMTLCQVEKRVNALRHEVYVALVEFGNEGEAELANVNNFEEGGGDMVEQGSTTFVRDSSRERQVLDTSRYRDFLISSERVDDDEEENFGQTEETWDHSEANDEDDEGEDMNGSFEEKDGNDEEDEDEDAEESRSEFVEELMLMGFPEDWCVLALKQTENDIVNASAWIVDNLEYLSKVQSKLDKELNQGRACSRFEEEVDDVAPSEVVPNDQPQRHSLDISHTWFHPASWTNNGETESDSQPTSDSMSLQQTVAVPILSDKETGRKVFGEMYFPFEEGGFLSNTKSSFMRSWKDESVEKDEKSPRNSSHPNLDNASEVLCEEFQTEIRRLDLKDLVKKLWTLENTLSLLYARQCVVTLLHQTASLRCGVASLQCWISYKQWLKLLKLVVFRGDQYAITLKKSTQQQELSINQVFSKAYHFFIEQEPAVIASTTFEFCLEQLETAATEKIYEATLWTHRSLVRSDNLAAQEPGIELVVWLLDLLLTSSQNSWSSFSLDYVKNIVRRLRCCLCTTNLPVKLVVLRTISRVLTLSNTHDQNAVIDSQLVVQDFMSAAKLRHSRELIQSRLLFSQYLLGHIELLIILQKLTDDYHETIPSGLKEVTRSSVSRQQQSEGNSLQFDRKRSRSSVLKFSDDDRSVSYCGNEIWTTACSTVGFSTGIHSWSVRIEKSNSPYLFVGVAARQASINSFLGADDQSWGFIGDKALYYQRNRIRAYGEAFLEGDCLGMRLDCERGELSFSKNGVELGVAFDNVVGEVCPGVALYSKHQKVSFIQDSYISSSGTSESNILCTGEEENANVEDCLTVCELMSNWISNTPMRPTLTAAAFTMTLEWLHGTKKFVTTRAGKSLWVDVTRKTCEIAGFFPEDRVRTPRGNATVLGVANGRLWVDVDKEPGAWFFHPTKLHPLTMPTTTSPNSLAHLSSNSSRPDITSDLDRAIAETFLNQFTLSHKDLVEFGEHSSWTIAADREMVTVVNDFCEISRIHPWNLTPRQLLDLFSEKTANSELTSIATVLAMSREKSEKMIVARFAILRFANTYFSRALPFFDLTWHYFSPTSDSLPCRLLSQCRGSIFVCVKNSFWTSLMERTAHSPSKSEDEYDYPEDLPQLQVNRMKAATAKRHQGSVSSLFTSLFGQSFEELYFLPVQTLRMVYSHPMDDGQLRSFKVKFEGEGVDDYGGPYREFFSQFFAELQMLQVLESEDSGESKVNRVRIGGLDRTSMKQDTNVACILPFFLPCPNWRNGVGANREKFVLNGATLNKASVGGTTACESAEEERELYSQMFYFLGQMIGICLRTRVCVRLDFAMSVWKQLVAEDDLNLESALETLQEIDFVAYSLWKTLQGMLDDSQRQNVVTTHKSNEELEAMDLVFTTVLSDGQIVELIEDGANTAVTLANLKEYIDLMLQARLQESKDVMNLVKQGLHSILPVSALALLTCTELEKRMCGVSEIDVKLLQENTEYDEDLSLNDDFVQRFWRVLESFELEDKRAFLRFVWARSRLPLGSAQFHQKFKIQALAPSEDANGSSNAAGTSQGWMDSQMPRSHTCFFALQLPRYSSDEICRNQILYAVRNCVEMDGDFRLADTEMTGWTDINPIDQLRI